MYAGEKQKEKHKTVVRYKNRFKKRKWIDEKRASKFGKGGGTEYRTNLKFYEDFLKGNRRMGRFNEPPTKMKKKSFEKYKSQLNKKEHRARIKNNLFLKENRSYSLYDAIPVEIRYISAIKSKKNRIRNSLTLLRFRKH